MQWVVIRHQYRISALLPQTFPGKSLVGGVAKHRLFSQVIRCLANTTSYFYSSLDFYDPLFSCKTPLKYIFKTILTIAYLAFLMIIWLSCIPALGIKKNNILQHGGKHKTKGHEQVAINGLKVRHTGHSTVDASYLQ